jgi:hypothetical protein
MNEIIKYSLDEPNVNIMIIKNSNITNNTITISNDIKTHIFLPLMYKSWTLPQSSHINFKIDEHITRDINNNNILYIFDTWGISSYYHLLIDHIIPLWITKNMIENILLENNEIIGETSYLRISDNNYPHELSTCKDIFKFFLNNNYTDNITGEFKYIIYGYCYSYRPYHGANTITYYPKYQTMLDKFINKFRQKSIILEKDKYIIIPDRQTRNYNGIQDIYYLLKKKYNVKKIDFGKYSIEEQIKLCASAWAIIGCEGAAFANQIFMNNGSLVIILCDTCNLDHIYFQSSLAKYMNHTFHTIEITDQTNNINIIENIEKYIINK